MFTYCCCDAFCAAMSPCVELSCEYTSAWIRSQALLGIKGAIVFDIDDTLILAPDECVQTHVRAVYECAQECGFSCCIVTARPETEENRRLTIDMLHQNGYDMWYSLYMMPCSIVANSETCSLYKRECRDDIETSHRIIANIGDMWSDLIRFPCAFNYDDILSISNDKCCLFFPIMSHGEFCLKLPSRCFLAQTADAISQ